MANLLLTLAGDLDFSSGGLQIVEGADEIAQKLFTRLQFFLGEWFLDRRQGIPYYEKILIKNPDLVIIQSIFREAILETPGVTSLLDVIQTDLESATRKLSVRFAAQLDSGGILNFDREFIIGD